MQGVPVLETQPTVSRNWGCRYFGKITKKYGKSGAKRGFLYRGIKMQKVEKCWSHAVYGGILSRI